MVLASLHGDPTASLALGYVSILCWLGAQAPQVIENYRLKSCDGLALPFLINWMCGDATNFLGCILTDQLEFQKYLSGYFCFIDIILLSQFYHYYTPAPSHPHKRISSIQSSPRLPSSPHISTSQHSYRRIQHRHSHSGYDELSTAAAQVARAAAAVAETRRGGGKGSRSHSRKRRAAEGHIASPRIPTHRIEIEDRMESGGLRNSQASLRSNASVVRSVSAGLVPYTQQRNQHGQQSAFRRPASWLPPPAPSPSRSRSTTGSSQYAPTSSLREVSFADPSDLPTTVPMRSSSSNTTPLTLSPTSERGRTLTRASPTMPYIGFTGATPPTTTGDALDEARIQLERSLSVRGNGMRRQHSGGEIGGGSTRGKGAAGVVLLGVMGLVGIGRGLVGVGSGGELGRPILGDGESGGRVIWASERTGKEAAVSVPSSTLLNSIIPSSSSPPPLIDDTSPHPIFLAFSDPSLDAASSSSSSHHSTIDNDDDDPPRHRHHDYPQPNPAQTWQHLIGRCSAWLCTVLYLTSRMPQIWLNFTRKSTEGLSSLLFLAAFCGNFTYVGSILINPLMDQPRPASTLYILEVLPFLIGSGGTLLFDVTILIQSYLYHSSPPIEESPWLHHHSHHDSFHHHHHHHHRTNSHSNGRAGGGNTTSSRSGLRVSAAPPPHTRSTSRKKLLMRQQDLEAAAPLLLERSPSRSRSGSRTDLTAGGLGLSFAGGGSRGGGGVAGWEREESGVDGAGGGGRGMMSVLEEGSGSLPSGSNWPWGAEEPGGGVDEQADRKPA